MPDSRASTGPENTAAFSPASLGEVPEENEAQDETECAEPEAGEDREDIEFGLD